MDYKQQALARALLGQGMAGQASDMMKLHPQWQQEMMQRQMNGQPQIPIEEWMKQRQLMQPNQ